MFQRRLSCLLTALLLCATPQAWPDDRLTEAQRLLNLGDAAGARLVLEGVSAERAGELEFDYLLALSMLDSGAASQALLAFERVLAVKPDFHGARLDYARALYDTGRLTEAAAELRRVAAKDPPAPARAAVDDYLARIDRLQKRARFSRFLSARTRAGYDTNVNSATELDEFLGFRLNPSSREQSSEYFEFGAAGGAAWQARAGLVFDGRLNVHRRVNGQASFADSDVFAGAASVRSFTETQRRSLTVQAFRLNVDGEENNSALALGGSWSVRVWPRWWLGATADVTAVRYGDALVIKDIDQYALGALASLSLGAPGQGTLSGRLRIGRDAPSLSESRWERDFVAAVLALDWRFNARVSGQLVASVENGDYAEVFFAQRYDAPRSDRTWRGRGVVDWRFADRWRVQHTLSYTLNDSDVDIFEFERFEVGLGLSYFWQ